MNEAAAHSTPGALEEGRRGASGQWWSVDFYYSYSRGRMVTHARARVFCSLKGTGFMELRISTDSTDQPTFARPPFPSAHPFRSSRSRFGSYAPTIFAVPRLGKIAVLQRLIPSRSAASVSTSSEHQRSRIALSRLNRRRGDHRKQDVEICSWPSGRFPFSRSSLFLRCGFPLLWGQARLHVDG